MCQTHIEKADIIWDEYFVIWVSSNGCHYIFWYTIDRYRYFIDQKSMGPQGINDMHVQIAQMSDYKITYY